MFKRDARIAVNKALGLFSKIVKDLKSSIELCRMEIEERERDIDIAEKEKEDVYDALNRAKSVLAKLEELLS